MGAATRVRIPQVTSIETAVKLYYSRLALSNKDIEVLFGKLGKARVARLKKLAREQMRADEEKAWNAVNVNTGSAYKAWGLDIADLERRNEKLKQLEKMT